MLLENLIEKNKEYASKGNVASYIPELAKADANELGACIITLSGGDM